MNRKKILQLIVATSTIAGGVLISQGTPVEAATINVRTVYNSPTNVSLKQGKIVNVTTSLRVRSAANTSASVLGYLNNGTTVSITGESGNWYKISYNGKDGYISKDYVQISGNTAPITTRSIASGKVTGVTTNLRVRSAASTTSSVLGYLTNGESVTITGESGNFYAINFKNKTGYVSKDYISKTGSSSNNTAGNNNSTSTTEAQSGTVVNVTSSLNVRSGPSTSSSIIGHLSNGAKVTVTGTSGDFYAIKYNNKTGYVSKSYVKLGGNTSSGTSNNTNTSTSTMNESGTVVNITSSLNVRSGPSTSSSIIGHLSNGAKVTVTGTSGDFYAIKYNNKTGYVSKSYVKLGGSSSGGTNTSTSTMNESGTVVNITSSLNVRSAPSTSSSIIGHLSNGAKVTVIGTSGDFYAIKYNNTTGYVSKNYVKLGGSSSSGTNTSTGTTNQTGRVVNVTSNLRVRSAPSTNASVLGYLLNGQIVTITGSSGDFYAINYNGKTGYVSKGYIQIGGSATSSQGAYQTILNAMKAHIGTPYVWGGSGEYLTTALLNRLSAMYPSQAANGAYTRAYAYADKGYRAFDCSGLMQWGYAQAGITIGRSTYDQINDGYEVSLNSVQPGDLLFYKSLGHVGMYIGNNEWIEAPNKNANVRITAVPWGSIGRARRILR